MINDEYVFDLTNNIHMCPSNYNTCPEGAYIK